MSLACVVFDTECATVRGAPHLLEIGAVRVADGDVVEHFDALVRPEVPIDAEAAEVHGIDDAMVRDARTASEVIADFVRFVGDDWLAAHDAARDALVLGFEAARHGIVLPDASMLDTLKLARRLIPEADDHKLDTLARHLEIDGDVHHRALADAVTCWKVLEECIARIRAGDAGEGAATAEEGEATAAEEGERAPADSRASGPTHGRRNEVGLASHSSEDPMLLRIDLMARAGLRLSLAESRPRPPRLPQRLRALASACRDRSRVMLLYGEDEIPARLEVAPRILFAMGERGYLEAECVRSGTIKTYRLDRVQKVLTA